MRIRTIIPAPFYTRNWYSVKRLSKVDSTTQRGCRAELLNIQEWFLFIRLFGHPAWAFRDASGPTIRLSRAAERATIERHGHVKE